MSVNSADVTHSHNIWLFVPNLIGYARILFTLWAYAVAFYDPVTCLSVYFLSFFLDAVDGYAARGLGQSSSFGAVLDMLIDRASTAGFILVLSHLMGPTYAFLGASLVALDVGSHFARMYTSLTLGQASHKDQKSRTSIGGLFFWLLDIYYSQRLVMFLFCVGQEMLYIFLYAEHFFKDQRAQIRMLTTAMFPFFFLKQVCNVLQLIDALQSLAEIDAEKRTKATIEAKKKK